MHRLCELTGDREAETAPRGPTAGVPPVEALEHVDCGLGLDPGAVVLDCERDPLPVAARPEADLRARRRMPERVLDERAADLEDPLLVAEAGRDPIHLVLHVVPGALRDGVELVDEELGHAREIDGLARAERQIQRLRDELEGVRG